MTRANVVMLTLLPQCHCEERSDEAISFGVPEIASLRSQ